MVYWVKEPYRRSRRTETLQPERVYGEGVHLEMIVPGQKGLLVFGSPNHIDRVNDIGYLGLRNSIEVRGIPETRT